MLLTPVMPFKINLNVLCRKGGVLACTPSLLQGTHGQQWVQAANSLPQGTWCFSISPGGAGGIGELRHRVGCVNGASTLETEAEESEWLLLLIRFSFAVDLDPT